MISVSSAEEQLLGLMLLHEDVVPSVLKAGVSARHYSSHRHVMLHDAIIDTYIANHGCLNAVMLAEFLEDRNELQAVGGISYLLELVDGTDTAERLDVLTTFMAGGRG
jgi:replicative DNA helicase